MWTSRKPSSDHHLQHHSILHYGRATGMDMPQPHARTHLFTVRLWLEDLGEGQREWRGEVRYVVSDEVRYFRDWQTLVELLQAMLPRTGSTRLPVADDPKVG